MSQTAKSSVDRLNVLSIANEFDRDFSYDQFVRLLEFSSIPKSRDILIGLFDSSLLDTTRQGLVGLTECGKAVLNEVEDPLKTDITRFAKSCTPSIYPKYAADITLWNTNYAYSSIFLGEMNESNETFTKKKVASMFMYDQYIRVSGLVPSPEFPRGNSRILSHCTHKFIRLSPDAVFLPQWFSGCPIVMCAMSRPRNNLSLVESIYSQHVFACFPGIEKVHIAWMSKDFVFRVSEFDLRPELLNVVVNIEAKFYMMALDGNEEWSSSRTNYPSCMGRTIYSEEVPSSEISDGIRSWWPDFGQA